MAMPNRIRWNLRGKQRRAKNFSNLSQDLRPRFGALNWPFSYPIQRNVYHMWVADNGGKGLRLAVSVCMQSKAEVVRVIEELCESLWKRKLSMWTRTWPDTRVALLPSKTFSFTSHVQARSPFSLQLLFYDRRKGRRARHGVFINRPPRFYF